jgi:integrase
LPLAVTRSQLRAHGTTAARALEFLIICAARSNETLGAVFGEIDFADEVWVIPGSRMKSGREHRVPLSRRAIEILREQRAFGESGPVFRGRDGLKPLGPTSLRDSLRTLGHGNITVHGFRSAFRDWCGDCTAFPREVAEAALAHIVGDKAEQSYRRGSALEKRRELMDRWAGYLARPGATGEVVPLRRGVP